MNNNSNSNDKVTKDKLRYERLGIQTSVKRFGRYLNAGLLEPIDEEFIADVQKFWEANYNKKIDPILHLAFSNLTGKKDLRIMPGTEMWWEIIPFFNDKNMAIGYRDKNIYDILIKTPRSAENVIKRVRGAYLDAENNGIDPKTAYRKLLDCNADLIIKPSDSNNGYGIAKLEFQGDNLFLNQRLVTLKDIEEAYGFNFIVQKIIQQHPIMAAPHPASVNTLRMVTLRWKNEIRYLLTFARFGADNNVKDNAGAGGICLGVTDSGEFLEVGIDEDCLTYTHHPTTNYRFADLGQIPNFEDFKAFVIDLHKDILHHDFVSWDIAVGADGLPVFIEANFAGATWIYQLASQKPLFGELTEEILQHVSSELAKGISRDITKSRGRKRKGRRKKLRAQIKKMDKRNKKLKKENKKLKRQLETKEKELELARIQYEKIKQSRSWRYTSVLRKAGQAYKSLFPKGN